MCRLLCTLNLPDTWCKCIATQIPYQCFFLTKEPFHLLSYKLGLFFSLNSPLASPILFLPSSPFECSLMPSSPYYFIHVLLNFPPLLFQLSSFVSFPPPISFLFSLSLCKISFPHLFSPILCSHLLSSLIVTL